MVKTEIHHSVAHVILDRPEVHNAFNEDVIKQLTEAFAEIEFHSDVRAVILRGTGKSFSSGADLNWTKRVASFTPKENLRDASEAIAMFLSVVRCPKPVIARVHGAPASGGSVLVASCDIGIAVESAQFGFTEVKWGIVPALISPFVIARIGAANAREYFLTGEKFNAETARSIGLIQHVVPDEAAMDALIETKIREIMLASPEAIAATKALILTVAGRPVESMSETTAMASVA